MQALRWRDKSRRGNKFVDIAIPLYYMSAMECTSIIIILNSHNDCKCWAKYLTNQDLSQLLFVILIFLRQKLGQKFWEITSIQLLSFVICTLILHRKVILQYCARDILTLNIINIIRNKSLIREMFKNWEGFLLGQVNSSSYR